MKEMIKVILADPSPVVGLGVQAAFKRTPDVDLVGHATDIDQIDHQCRTHQPDLLLVNVSLLATMQAGPNCSTTNMLALSAADGETTARYLRSANIRGCVLLDEPIDVLHRAVRTVARGSCFFSQDVWHALQARRDAPIELTQRERDILTMLDQGASIKDIALLLHVAEQTIRNNLHNLYIKVGVNSQGKAVAWFRNHGGRER